MTAHAGRRAQVVVAIGVALRTLHADVCSREWEASLRVVEGCRLPCRGRVADFALLREAG